jgi:hypothetical protein
MQFFVVGTYEAFRKQGRKFTILLGSISTMFYEHLLSAQIPKKDTKTLTT